jgi:predicted TIM-barrel fold metal-dependent hydrolase
MNTRLPPTDRRAFLKTALTAAASLLASPAWAASRPRRGYIDAHVHVWTSDLQKYPIAKGFSVRKDMDPPSFTPEELFANCRPQGVERIVLVQMSFYKFDNRYMLDSMHAHPGVFSGIGIIDHDSPNVLADMRHLTRQGVRGFRLYGKRRQVESWFKSPGMQAMWKQAADDGIAMCILANPNALPAVHRMCEAHPKTRVVIDHFARIGMKGSIHQTDVDNLRRLAAFPHVYVKTSAFYALGQKKAPYTDLAPLIRTLRDAFGSHRLMWASDCPFQVQKGHTYADSIALIRDRLDFLTPEEKSWMLHRTAERVFFT